MLSDDCDSNDKPASATWGSQEPTHGTLVRNADSSFTYTVSGGNGAPDTGTFEINVNAVNDTSSFTKGPDQTVDADAGARSVPGWATGISPGPSNESGQSVSFVIVDNTKPLLFTCPECQPVQEQPAVSQNGTPAANAKGTAEVSVKIKDDGGVDESAVETFFITVNP